MIKLENISNYGLRKVLAFVLVGTMATGATAGKVVYSTDLDNNRYVNEFVMGHYYNEDIKAEQARIQGIIVGVGSSKAKSYSKK